MTKIVIMDDQLFYREAVKGILEIEEEFEIVGEGGNGSEVVPLYEEHDPDIILMEVHLAQMNGIEATEKLIKEHPNAKVIMFSMNDEDSFVLQALKAGARGFMLKEMDSVSIIQAIQIVARGGSYIHPKVTKKVLIEYQRLVKNEHKGSFKQTEIRKPYHLLTKRECEVLQLLADGQSNRMIGETIYISEKTVKNHVSSVLFKMKVNDRTNAVVTAIKNGWVMVN